MSVSKGAQVRRNLSHPVIDADGHWLELYPVFFDYVREVAGPQILEKVRSRYGKRRAAWYGTPVNERQRQRMCRPAFWTIPTGQDRAAGTIPALFRERLDDCGIDLALVFPSLGFTLSRDVANDPELIGGVMRAYNTMAADLFRPHADRVIPVGVVSLNDPKEAIAQLEHAHSLGLKMVTVGGGIPRQIEADADWQPDPGKRRIYIDGLGLDNPHDYDPVWRKFVELKIPVASHIGSMGWPDRSSPSNFVANHIGHFAQSHHLFARSLFLGGVTERFPTLNFAFLEGGVGWACNLYADLLGHWEKRNKKFMAARLKPTNLDRANFRELYERYTRGNKRFEGKIDDILARNLDVLESDTSAEELTERDIDTDDFANVHIESKDDIRRLFGRNFYFGCEADDPMTAVAFNEKMGLRLKPVFGSDISHFDVPDAAEVLKEAWELVEHGLINEQNFRDFTFTNAVDLYCRMNPEFFEGTVIEQQVRHTCPSSG